MKSWLRIRKLEYLKTPIFDWTLENSVGGVFASRIQARSLKACIEHFRKSQSTINENMKVIIETWHGFDDSNEPVVTKTESYLMKLHNKYAR